MLQEVNMFQIFYCVFIYFVNLINFVNIVVKHWKIIIPLWRNNIIEGNKVKQLKLVQAVEVILQIAVIHEVDETT